MDGAARHRRCGPAACRRQAQRAFLLPQLGFILALVGIVLSVGGMSLLKVTLLPIAFLIFAIPLPYVVDAGLSFQLQLLSSQLGVAFIRLFRSRSISKAMSSTSASTSCRWSRPAAACAISIR